MSEYEKTYFKILTEIAGKTFESVKDEYSKYPDRESEIRNDHEYAVANYAWHILLRGMDFYEKSKIELRYQFGYKEESDKESSSAGRY